MDQNVWSQYRSFALNLAKKGFIDPISILYTSFKRLYPSHVSLYTFSQWLLLDELNKVDFPINSLRYSTFQKADDISKGIETTKQIEFVNPLTNIEQIWFLLPISMLLSTSSYSLTPETIILDYLSTMSSLQPKKTSSPRLHCILAVTPSGKYSNQLFIVKSGRYKINCPSTPLTRIIEVNNGDFSHEHVQIWLDDFLSSSFVTKDR